MRPLLPLALLTSSCLNAQVWNAYTQVYNDSVFADTAFASYPGSSACPGTVTITFPPGEVVDSVRVAYDYWSFTSLGGGTTAMQRSLLRCSNTGLDEGALVTCTVCAPSGEEQYERTTSIANGVSSGSVTIELHLGTTRSTSAPNCSVYDEVEIGQWSTTVYTHATGAGLNELVPSIDLEWTGETLRINAAAGRPSTLEIIDLSGRTLWAEDLRQTSGTMEVRLPERLRGALCARITNAQGVGHLRFVR